MNGVKCHYYLYQDDNLNWCSSAITKQWTQSVINHHLQVAHFVCDALDILSLNEIPCKYVLRHHVDNGDETVDDVAKNILENVNVSLFRSNPSTNGEEWYDWAWFRWNDEDTEKDVPARIYMFVDLRNVNISELELNQKGFSKSIYACIRSLVDLPTQLHKGRKILFKSKLEDIPDKYRLIDVNSITASCYVIPNFVSIEDEIFEEWIILENRYRWSEHFILE